MTKIELIISLLIFILIIVHNIYQKRKYKEVYKSEIYNQSKKINKYLYLFSFIIFILIIIIQIIFEDSTLTTIVIFTYIINALSIGLIPLPLTLSNLYIINFKDEEKISHTKTIVTNIIDQKMLVKFKKAGINLLILSEEQNTLGLKTIKESEIKESITSRNVIIETDNLKCLDDIVDSKTTLFEFKNLNKAYKKIFQARGVHDNFIKATKFTITTYMALLLSYFILLIFNFPIKYNLLFILLIKLYTLLITEIIYKKLPFDKDIMNREVKPSHIFIEKQEMFFDFIEAFCISFATSIPYMGVLAQGASQELATTLFILIFLYTNILLTYSYLNEKFFLINIFKSYQNIRLLIYTIIHILITISFNFITCFGTMNVKLQNNISSIIFGMLPIMFLELIKLARFTSMKGNKKNETKNNKKYKRG